MKSVDAYLKKGIEVNASDVHLVADEIPRIRVNSVLKEVGKKTLPVKQLKEGILKMIGPEYAKTYKERKDLDMGYQIDGVRFRMNVHQQAGKIALAARIIPEEIPTPEELNFSGPLLDFTKLMDGLVLIVGPTGHGKSTTIASMIEQINQNKKAHIITIEDPVEFVFKDKESLIEQREVGKDTKSFASALKHVLRQDPDVIFVGEMRDPETIATVLTAAETGHLVFSTLHTANAAESIERIVDVFEGSKQRQALIQLGAVLRAVVAQQLIVNKDGGLIAAREILINTPAVANLIRENNISQISSAIQTGGKHGMVTMENAVRELYKKRIIDKKTAQNRMSKKRIK